jgi:hypothetical protein
LACPSVASPDPYGVGEGLAEADALTDPDADAAAEAEPLAAALPEALGPAEKLGRGAGVGEGKRVVGTFASESAKIRMKITKTITTHGLASESVRGGRAPR